MYKTEQMKAKRKLTVVIERGEEGYYVSSGSAVGGCHNQAKTLHALMARTPEIIEPGLEERAGVVKPLELIGIRQIPV